jgi:hypothetical protein
MKHDYFENYRITAFWNEKFNEYWYRLYIKKYKIFIFTIWEITGVYERNIYNLDYEYFRKKLIEKYFEQKEYKKQILIKQKTNPFI